MRLGAVAALALVACVQQHRTNIDPGRIEDRERSFGVFNWAPPPIPRKAAPADSPETNNPAVLASPAPSASVVAVAPAPPVWDAESIARRRALAADWSAHAGEGITQIQTFGDGDRGIVAFGAACSDAWLDTNVAPIWDALKQNGFLAVHCQGAVQRFSWPRAH
jgi:hypothetical protein